MISRLAPAEVREIRRALGLTQAQLAEALGLAGDGARSVRNWEKDGPKHPISGPAAVALTYLAQGALDETMKTVIPEYAMGGDGEEATRHDILIRLWRPRFVGVLHDPRTPVDGLDSIAVAPDVEQLTVALWIDDPDSPPGWDRDDLLKRAAAFAENYTLESFDAEGDEG